MGWYDSPFGVGSSVSAGGFAWQPTVGMQFSVGSIARDLGDAVITAAGEVLRVAIDEFGRRIIQKTGEVLSRTPLGPATTVPYVTQQVDWLPIAVVAGLALFLFRR